MKHFSFEITGSTPLIMHADNIPWADQMTEWKKKSKDAKSSPAGDDRHPAYRWIGCLCNNGVHVGIPSNYMTTCLMKAASRVSTGSRNKTFKTESVAMMGFNDELFPIVTKAGEVRWEDVVPMVNEPEFSEHQSFASKHGFELHICRASVGASKHIRVRPKFNSWKFAGTLWVDNDSLASSLPEIFEMAGNVVGLGDWRPSAPKKPGPYGRFSATIKEIK